MATYVWRVGRRCLSVPHLTALVGPQDVGSLHSQNGLTQLCPLDDAQHERSNTTKLRSQLLDLIYFPHPQISCHGGVEGKDLFCHTFQSKSGFRGFTESLQLNIWDSTLIILYPCCNILFDDGQEIFRPALGPIMYVPGCYFWKLTAQKHEPDHSSPCTTKGKHTSNYNSNPNSIILHGVSSIKCIDNVTCLNLTHTHLLNFQWRLCNC
jgi:hypothetical protein